MNAPSLWPCFHRSFRIFDPIFLTVMAASCKPVSHRSNVASSATLHADHHTANRHCWTSQQCRFTPVIIPPGATAGLSSSAVSHRPSYRQTALLDKPAVAPGLTNQTPPIKITVVVPPRGVPANAFCPIRPQPDCVSGPLAERDNDMDRSLLIFPDTPARAVFARGIGAVGRADRRRGWQRAGRHLRLRRPRAPQGQRPAADRPDAARAARAIWP